MIRSTWRWVTLAVICYARWANAALNATEDDTKLVIENDRLHASLSKESGKIDTLRLDGEDLLGPTSGSTGFLYLDCYCTPSGFWTPGTTQPEFELYSGTDSTGTSYGGIRVSDTYTLTGQILEQFWFLRDELRTLFRPNTGIWTHLSTNEIQFAPLPGDEAVSSEVVVQDATWYLGNTPNDAYVQQESDYFTKYTFQDTWRDHGAHGLFADGSRTADNTTLGAWLVMNTKDTYFGGPLHSDLTVDGIVYNYISSNHHGNQVPNITNGFDRTFGPQYYYFNHFPAGSKLEVLREDAVQYANPVWNSEFYDCIAKHVPNYVPTRGRGTLKLQVDLPETAKNPLAVLAQNGIDFQDNVFDTEAYQYWTELDKSGKATVERVKSGIYRLTIYADGIFGNYIQDDIEITAGAAQIVKAHWVEESAGVEVFRIGTPDKSSGEYRHGYEPDATHSLHPEQYRIYWGAYDYVEEFPNGVTFKVGESDVGRDLNYVHWSAFGGLGNSAWPDLYVGNGNVNNWTLIFDVVEDAQIHEKEAATFTVQLAGVKTAAGNTDDNSASEPQANLKYTVNVNGHDLESWVIPYYQSSSCAVRSAVICYNVANKFVFNAALLKTGENRIVLSLPFNATDHETAILPGSVYVQYDALRLEVR